MLFSVFLLLQCVSFVHNQFVIYFSCFPDWRDLHPSPQSKPFLGFCILVWNGWQAQTWQTHNTSRRKEEKTTANKRVSSFVVFMHKMSNCCSWRMCDKLVLSNHFILFCRCDTAKGELAAFKSLMIPNTRNQMYDISPKNVRWHWEIRQTKWQMLYSVIYIYHDHPLNTAMAFHSHSNSHSQS